MRFCMITSFYPPYNFGGDGIYVRRLSNELARRGHEVDVIHCIDAYRIAAPLPHEEYCDHPNVTVHGLKSRWGPLSPLLTQQTGFPFLKSTRIRQILKKDFDVIHYHNISLVGGPGILAFGKAIKLYTMHDYWLLCPTHSLFRFNRAPCLKPRFCSLCSLVYRRPPQLWRYFGVLERAMKHVDAFIAPSLTSQRKHEQMNFKGRIVHIPNFVPEEPDHGSGTELPSATDAGHRYFLFVGRLEKLKGLRTILPVFQRDTSKELWIAGTGTEEPYLREVTRQNLNIRFLGQQSSANLQVLYRDAIALIYPSENFQVGLPIASVIAGQGAPLVIMEAFSQKTPVIASRTGRIPALLEQIGGGLIYSTEQELTAALDRLLVDPAYRRDLGLRGFEAYQQRWSVETHLDLYFALINDITSKQRAKND